MMIRHLRIGSRIELDPNGAPLWTHAKRVNSNGYYFKPEDDSWISALPKSDGAEVKPVGERGRKSPDEAPESIL